MFTKYFYIPAILLLLLTSIYVSALTRNSIKEYNYIGISEEKRHTIVIDGEGSVHGTPNIANINLGLQTENESIEAAQKNNTETMNTIISKLKKEINVNKNEIQTTNYSINPRYDWNEGQRTLKGYTVSQNLKIKIKDLTKISKIIGLAGEYNLNQVGGLNFSIENPENLQKEARIKALNNAKEKANALSQTLDVKLGRIIGFSEREQASVYPVMRSLSISEDAQYKNGSAIPELEAGSQEIKSHVNVEYEIY